MWGSEPHRTQDAPGRGRWAGACPSLLSSRGEAGYAQGLQAQVSGVKANCISSCQPQEERRKHHLSAGADSVGDCSGLLQRFKWKWPELPGPMPGREYCPAEQAERGPW